MRCSCPNNMAMIADWNYNHYTSSDSIFFVYTSSKHTTLQTETRWSVVLVVFNCETLIGLTRIFSGKNSKTLKIGVDYKRNHHLSFEVPEKQIVLFRKFDSNGFIRLAVFDVSIQQILPPKGIQTHPTEEFLLLSFEIWDESNRDTLFTRQ